MKLNSLLKSVLLYSSLLVLQAQELTLDPFQLANSSLECHASIFQINITFLMTGQQKGLKNNINSAVYDIFMSIISICGYDESIEELALVFGFTKEKVIKVIECFGEKIPVVSVDKMPALKKYEKIIFISILALLLFISVIGNTILLFFLTQIKFSQNMCKRSHSSSASVKFSENSKTETSTRTSRQFKVTDVFFILIAVFDILFAVYILPLQMSDALNDGVWQFTDYACSVYSYLNYLMLAINMITLMTIAIDRYSRIVANSSSQREKSQNLKTILNKITCSNGLNNDPKVATLTTYLWMVVLVTVSCLICLPYLIYSEKTAVVMGPNCFSITEDYMCVNSWRNNEFAGHIYKIVLFVFVYIIPIIVLVTSYVKISIKLNYSKQNLTRFYKKRLIKLLIIDFVLYLICWFPFLIWMIFLCLRDLGVIKIEIEFGFQYYVFNLLFMGPIINVSLKWIFRTLCSLKRFKMDVNRKKSKANLFKSIATVTPVTPIINNDCSFSHS